LVLCLILIGLAVNLRLVFSEGETQCVGGRKNGRRTAHNRAWGEIVQTQGKSAFFGLGLQRKRAHDERKEQCDVFHVEKNLEMKKFGFRRKKVRSFVFKWLYLQLQPSPYIFKNEL
jgi:hypothetical protein